MTTIITRSTGPSPKGAPLTAGELDQNFLNLNAAKVEATRAVGTTAGELTGGGDLSGDRTLGLAATGITAGLINNSATQLTPTTLDNKGRVVAIGTPVTIAPAFSSLTGTPTSLAGYGITDAQPTLTGAATTIDSEDLTASKVLVSDASGKVAASAVSTTTLGYLDASSSVQGQLDSKQATTAKNAANGYAGLDAGGKLPTSLLPALAISEYLGAAANQAARLALTGEKGDWCSQTDTGKVYVITGDTPSDNTHWTALTYPVTPGITLNGTHIAPGDTATVTAATPNTLTIGTGLTGTSFNGSAAVTVAIDASVVTLTGTQTLTNKTLTAPVIAGGSADGLAIGGTAPASGAFTTLSATGNTTLGDAAGDTLTINGTAVSCPNNLNFDSNTLFIDATNNYVGIGTSSPSGVFDVQKYMPGVGLRVHLRNTASTAGSTVTLDFSEDATLRSGIQYESNTGLTKIGNISTGNYPVAFYAGATEKMRINSSGNLLVGTTSNPGGRFVCADTTGTYTWHFGTINTLSNYYIVRTSDGVGAYLGYGSTSWAAASDERVKDIIEPITHAAAKVDSLRAVIGKYKTDAANTRRAFLIAQDVQAVLPEAVDASNPDSLGVQYTDTIPLLVAAIKELHAEIQSLKAKVN